MHTANFVAAFTRLDIGLIEITLYSHLLLTNTVRFEPMNLSKVNRTIIEADIGKPFQLSPAPFAIALLKQRENPNAAIKGNRFYLHNRSYDFKVHGVFGNQVSVGRATKL
jgi:hypothetical protein